MYVACDWNETPTRCRNIQYAIASPLAILGFVNSLTNPFIYAWWHNGFRESVKSIFCGAACRKKRGSESDPPTMSTGRTSQSSGAAARPITKNNVNGGCNRGRAAIGVSTTTLDMSTTDVDHTDVDGSVSDVESALRYRVVEAASPQPPQNEEEEQRKLQQRAPINGTVASVCYQPAATARH